MIMSWSCSYNFLLYEFKNYLFSDFTDRDKRLLIVISGIEYHIYNKCSAYDQIEKLFGDGSNNRNDKKKKKQGRRI